MWTSWSLLAPASLAPLSSGGGRARPGARALAARSRGRSRGRPRRRCRALRCSTDTASASPKAREYRAVTGCTKPSGAKWYAADLQPGAKGTPEEWQAQDGVASPCPSRGAPAMGHIKGGPCQLFPWEHLQ